MVAVSSVETEVSPSGTETNSLVSRSCSSGMRIPIEKITADECKEELKNTFLSLQDKLGMHSIDTNFLRGVSKFCDRVNKFPHSMLSSALHSFGVKSSSSLKIIATQLLDKKRKGKIFLQRGS